jgi:large subunit ribosomal protein L23
MPILNIFKKNKKEKQDRKTEKKVQKESLKKIPEKTRSKKEARPFEKRKGKISETAWKVLKSPHVTEKATDLGKNNQYVFKVWPKSNKKEIKKAVEELFEVSVSKVQIVKIPSKKMRMGKIEGEKKGYKKAIVKLEKGQKIEILPR